MPLRIPYYSIYFLPFFFFFFSSRRRHTRLVGDWSSDVCSSDLTESDEEEVLFWPGPPIGYAAPLRPEQVETLDRLGLTLDEYGWLGALQMGIPALLFILIAAFLFWQKSDDWMVLFVSVMAGTFPLQQVPLAFTLMMRQPAWAVVNNIPLALVAFLGFPLIFPTGQFVPRWTRWFAPFLFAGAILASRPQTPVLRSSPVLGLILVWLLTSFGIGVYAQLYRYFRVATPAERQQLKWAIAGLAGYLIGSFLVLIPLEAALNSAADIDPALALALSAIPDTLWQLLSL